MSVGSLNRWLRSRRLDVDAAILGLVIAVALFPLRFFASQVYIETIPLVLGVACILYLLAGAKSGRTETALPSLPASATRMLPSIVIAGTAALVLVAVHAGERSVLFYDLAGVLGTLLVAQVVFAPDAEFRRDLLLAQIVVFAAVVRFAALYTNPGFIGIDLWTHLPRLADGIMTERSLAAISEDKHFAAPLYHLYVVGNALLYDSSLRTALYLSLGALMPLSSIVVYATANLLVEERWAVLAALLYSIADYAIEWSLHIIPTSHGLLLFLGVLYLVTRMMRTKLRVRDFTLLSLLSMGLILTHQVSTFIMLVLLSSAIAAQVLIERGPFGPSPTDPNPFRTGDPVNLFGLVVFDVGFTLFMWSFTPYAGADQPFLALVVSYLAQTVQSSAGVLNLIGGTGGSAAAASGGPPTFVEQVAVYVDAAGFLLLLAATFVGCLYVVNRKRASQPTFTLLFASAVMLVFVLGFPLFGINNFVPQRWFAFLYAPMTVLGVVGVRHLAGSLDRRVFVAVVVVFALAYPSAMLMSSHGAIDNPVFSENRERLSYTEPELAAVSTIGEMTGSPDRDSLTERQVLFTDHPYQTVFTRTRSYPADAAVVNGSRPVTHDFVVYREYQSSGAAYFPVSEGGNGMIQHIPPERLCRPGMGTVYTNGNVLACSTE